VSRLPVAAIDYLYQLIDRTAEDTDKKDMRAIVRVVAEFLDAA
jgi:hypothetical protein